MNPWALPKATSLQDFHGGELSATDIVHLQAYLPRGGDGRFRQGPQQGLVATFSSLLQEGDWTYMQGGRVDTARGLTVGAQGSGAQGGACEGLGAPRLLGADRPRTSPSSIIESTPSGLTGVTEPIASESAPISTTSTF